MDALARLLYAAAGQAARGAAAATPSGGGKLLRAVAARRGIRARYAAWARERRDPSRPLLWMHAPSVGEGLQARPVLERFRQRRPELQLAYTHFSPSAERFARGLDVDFADYLPFDTAADARHALDALRPSALVFSKLDVWPMLSTAAHRRGIPLGLVSATLAAGSSRSRGVAARLLRQAYAALDLVGAIDEADARRLVALGVREHAITVTGDTRYDQVWARAQAADRTGPLLAPLASDRPTLVAGSTWPADERALLPAWVVLRRQLRGARLVIAPHEPTSAHLTPVERWASDTGLRLARLDAADATAADVILVDRVGVLGDLYALADVAFVGGGFHAAGLHSVLEPAAFGAPVLFGPRHTNSRDAGILIAAGGAVAAVDASALATALIAWLGDLPTAAAAGAAARTVVESGLGAAERSYALVEQLLNARG
ncbi:MAG TPA: glycosyltransferase N-terminal domain-containing protein [Gemmatimonadaceae bacterium]|nr:glycosyltransferase N-terminal domain-containing protein [Gemmatimonadaceae bacterium]